MQSTIENGKMSIMQAGQSRSIFWIRLVVIGVILAAGFSSCVVYAHPYHPYHHYYHHW